LVGASGSGKSTIVQLLLRFYDVDDGSVTFDKHDIRQYDLQWLRKNFAIVPQEPTLFNRSIEANIKYGCEDATHEQVCTSSCCNSSMFVLSKYNIY
jgi:ABC-type multidrug transport system fused ATPase/permease subunit